jgi:RNA polymerase sigma-54 factor
MKQALQLRLGQHLTMTPQLQQAIRLLQLSTLDLKQEIQEALDSNLMLESEEDERGGEEINGAGLGGSSAEETATSKADSANEREIDATAETLPEELPVDSGWDDVYDVPPPPAGAQRESGDTDFLLQGKTTQTLHDHLLWQLNLTPFEETDRAIATAIIDAISEDGYLTSSLEDISTAVHHEDLQLDEVEAVLHRLQCFDPPGVGARNARECLLLQLRQFPEKTPLLKETNRLVENHFDLLARQDHGQIKRRLKLSDEQLKEVNRLIQSLNPRPGTLVADSAPDYVVPDVFVSRKNGTWQVELNPDSTPRLRVNSDYAKLIRRADSSDDNNCLKNHLQEARWFIKSLVSRNETLLRVATKIVEFQRGFLEYGEEAMRPLVLRDVADALEMHESTISRVTTHAIRALIRKLVAAEKPNKPLSDNKIAAILADQGIKVARRTIAKYRESMAIPPSNERKRLA